MNTSTRRKRIWAAVMFALALPLVAGGQDAGEAEPRGVWYWVAPRPPWVQPTSIFSVLADPAAFDGREIRMIGYVSLDAGQHAIWLVPSDYENSVLANSIGIGELISQSLLMNGYAEVQGIFHAAGPDEPRAGSIAPKYLRPWFLANMRTPPPPRQRCSLWF